MIGHMDAEQLLIFRKHKAEETMKAWPYEKVSQSMSDIVELPHPGAAEWTPWDQSFHDYIEYHKDCKFLVGNVGDDTWFLFTPAHGHTTDSGLWFVLSPTMKAKGLLGSRALPVLREVAEGLRLI